MHLCTWRAAVSAKEGRRQSTLRRSVAENMAPHFYARAGETMRFAEARRSMVEAVRAAQWGAAKLAAQDRRQLTSGRQARPSRLDQVGTGEPRGDGGRSFFYYIQWIHRAAMRSTEEVSS